MNREDQLIERGVAALRAESAPDAPQSFVAAMTSPKHAPSARPVRMRAAVGLACGLAVASVVMWPKASPAEDLKRVVDRMGAGDFLRHEKGYTVKPNGTLVLAWDIYAKGERLRMITCDASGKVQGDQSFDGERTVIYWPAEGFGVIEKSRARATTLAGPGTIAHILQNPSNTKIDKDAAIEWRGRLADRYTIDFSFIDGRKEKQEGKLTLYADPQTDRPLYQMCDYAKLPDFAMEWDYPASGDSVLDVAAPKGTPIYDTILQAEQARSAVLTPIATDVVQGRKIELRGVFVDHNNELVAVYSGGDGRPGIDWDRPNEARLKIEGLGEAENGGGYAMKQQLVGGRYDHLPTTYKGLKILTELGRFPKSVQIPDTFTLQVPVWFREGKGQDEHFELAGYAKFKVSHPVRTGAVPFLIAPQNLSIFSDDYTDAPAVGGQATMAG